MRFFSRPSTVLPSWQACRKARMCAVFASLISWLVSSRRNATAYFAAVWCTSIFSVMEALQNASSLKLCRALNSTRQMPPPDIACFCAESLPCQFSGDVLRGTRDALVYRFFVVVRGSTPGLSVWRTRCLTRVSHSGSSGLEEVAMLPAPSAVFGLEMRGSFLVAVLMPNRGGMRVVIRFVLHDETPAESDGGSSA